MATLSSGMSYAVTRQPWPVCRRTGAAYGIRLAVTPTPERVAFVLSGSGNCSDSSELHLTGKERDTESGNDDFGARYYASTMGRFLNPDPGWFMEADRTNPQTWNLYSYALNNPLKLIDPNGMDQCIWDDGTSDDRPEDGGATQQECEDQGGNWAADTDTTITVTPQSTDPNPSCSDFTGALAPPSGPINYRQQAQSNSQQTRWSWYQSFKGGGRISKEIQHSEIPISSEQRETSILALLLRQRDGVCKPRRPWLVREPISQM